MLVWQELLKYLIYYIIHDKYSKIRICFFQNWNFIKSNIVAQLFHEFISVNGPSSKNWNPIPIFKNANKLIKNSWRGVNVERTSYFFTNQSNIFHFYMHSLLLEVFDFSCCGIRKWCKSVIMESGRGLR